ncbi:MAG: carbohydrate-binding family 9-like protein [Acidobacteriota bacterium]
MPLNTLFTYRTGQDKAALLDHSNPLWNRCERATIDRYWSGQSALKEKGYNWNNLTRVSSLWNEDCLFFYFKCWFEALNVNPEWNTQRKIHGLWERDVVEAFIKPESCDDYFEIEVSPAGQWLDLHVIKPRVDVDFHWESGLDVQVEIKHEERLWRTLIALPFEPMLETAEISRRPAVGDAWRLNLFRCAGEQPDREYLAWRPTFTPQSDFHVPSSFGNLIFLEK